MGEPVNESLARAREWLKSNADRNEEICVCADPNCGDKAAKSLADWLATAVREARVEEHKLLCRRCALIDSGERIHDSLQCERLRSLSEPPLGSRHVLERL